MARYILAQDIDETEQIKVTASGAKVSGDLETVGGRTGFWLTDVVDTEQGVLITRAPIAKVNAAVQAWTAGDAVYDDNPGTATAATAAGVQVVGYVYEDITNTAGNPEIPILFTGGNG